MHNSMVDGQVDPAVAATHSDDSASALLDDWLSDCGQACALFLDVDGTLLDIADTPDAVRVPHVLPAALKVLHRRLDGALALVSGRSVDNLDCLFPLLRLPASGGHGAHWRVRADAPLCHETTRVLSSTLREKLMTLACSQPGVICEDKGSSVAMHYRRVPAAGEALAAALHDLLDEPGNRGVRLLPGKMVLEVVAHSGDKSQAIRRFLEVTPFAGRRPLFIGDDVTDEAALALMPALGGLGLSVGKLLPGASAAFADAAAVRLALIKAAGGLPR